ncbi:hypothetical protein S7711_03014 [Stachybotrys chartarum IBT 7711]|uniref:Probable aspartic-type endopeptidase OPSB n=1 Tax=Stachybotrys chartarum (strain CBS 109288 / IBT 7711) TaxID=1280523 RepID=A0A084APC5_STACB|nr:hypothetical protein S7711_03014 [Stachybotrys chartarum IBT 7711]KFA46767.1 hypothetical protein S40293_06786 [Stachybotrys chartarum IBT 40293]
MKPTPSSLVLLLLGITFLSAASAISLHKREDGAPRVLSLDIQRDRSSDPLAHARARNKLRRRQSGSVDVTIDNLETLYYFNASLGTPPQEVRLHLDTGSSDLWVNSPDSRLCTMPSNPCALAGTYVANSSSTYNYLGSYFNISYIDGSGASGDYVTDSIEVANARLSDFQFGVGYVSTSAQGILGIGYKSNEVQVARSGMAAYDNLPAKMASDGHIASNAFSMWLNNLEASTGSLLFGGVNRAQYQGQLTSVPIQRVGNQFREFYITLTKLALGSTVIDEEMQLGVLLDSGSTLTYLPDNLVEAIYNITNAVYQENEGVAFVPCALGEQTANMTFTFSEPAAIAVPISELVIDLVDVTGRQLSFANGVPACLFGVAPAGDSTIVLGDTFLRSAYVVYDLENNEISLAQTVFNATESDIAEIGTGSRAVPLATAAERPVSATSGLPISSAARAHRPTSVKTAALVVAALLLGAAGAAL